MSMYGGTHNIQMCTFPIPHYFWDARYNKVDDGQRRSSLRRLLGQLLASIS